MNNIRGKKYGNLTAVSFDHIEKRNNRNICFWKFVCDCGNEKVIRKDNVVSGNTTSCGCTKKKEISKRRHKDIENKKFNNLTAIKFFGVRNDKSLWLCRCDCGNETVVSYGNLISGVTKSCGCIRKKPRKHGKTKTRIHRIWIGMKSRCYNKNQTGFKYWGGRGITVCNEWKNSFISFYNWAIKNGYNDNLTIDRINNDKGYSSDNCRWATKCEQSKNRRCCKNRREE